MIAGHVHDALEQVRRVRRLVLDRRLFRGYSGPARMAGGLAALVGAAVMSHPRMPRDSSAHLTGWIAVLAVALSFNYGALARWAWQRWREADAAAIRPALDAMPALVAAVALSWALVRVGQWDLLPGAWMVCYGLVHMPYRYTLPRGNFAVGLAYLFCGLVMLLWPGARLFHPWIMGGVFGAGEMAGGALLWKSALREAAEAREEGEEISDE